MMVSKKRPHCCHCEERSDAAISFFQTIMKGEIASLRSQRRLLGLFTNASYVDAWGRSDNNLFPAALRAAGNRGGKRDCLSSARSACGNKAVKTDCPLRGLPLTAAIGIFQPRAPDQQAAEQFSKVKRKGEYMPLSPDELENLPKEELIKISHGEIKKSYLEASYTAEYDFSKHPLAVRAKIILHNNQIKDDHKLSKMTLWILILTVIIVGLTAALVYSEFSTTKSLKHSQPEKLNPVEQQNNPQNKNDDNQRKNQQSHDLPPKKSNK